MGASQRSRGEQAPERAAQLEGLRLYVAAGLRRYREGVDSRRLLLQQSLAKEKPGTAGEAQLQPAVKMMQQVNRIIVLTLEASLPRPQTSDPRLEAPDFIPQTLTYETMKARSKSICECPELTAQW